MKHLYYADLLLTSRGQLRNLSAAVGVFLECIDKKEKLVYNVNIPKIKLVTTCSSSFKESFLPGENETQTLSIIQKDNNCRNGHRVIGPTKNSAQAEFLVERF